MKVNTTLRFVYSATKLQKFLTPPPLFFCFFFMTGYKGKRRFVTQGQKKTPSFPDVSSIKSIKRYSAKIAEICFRFKGSFKDVNIFCVKLP